MKGLFVDTAGWMACADAADRAHRLACAARDRALEDGLPLVTTDFVADETLTLLRFRPWRVARRGVVAAGGPERTAPVGSHHG